MEKELNSEILECRSKEHRCELTGFYLLKIILCTCSVQELYLSAESVVCILPDLTVNSSLIVKIDDCLFSFFCSLLGLGESHNMSLSPVIDSLEVLT